VHDDDGSMLRVERPEGVVEQVAVGEITRHVGPGRRVEVEQLDLDHALLPVPCEIEAGIDGEAMKPAVE
jgi:hypothetical protein